VVLNGLHADGCGQVGFARARAADEHDVLCILQELAAMQ
jgi:hypothetical protein